MRNFVDPEPNDIILLLPWMLSFFTFMYMLINGTAEQLAYAGLWLVVISLLYAVLSLYASDLRRVTKKGRAEIEKERQDRAIKEAGEHFIAALGDSTTATDLWLLYEKWRTERGLLISQADKGAEL